MADGDRFWEILAQLEGRGISKHAAAAIAADVARKRGLDLAALAAASDDEAPEDDQP